MSALPARLNELLASDRPELDRVLAVVASAADHRAPPEDEVVAQLDQVAAGCPDGAGVDGVLDHVHRALGFTGDRADYYNPANSMLHQVIERRRGIPLTLAAVVAEVGRRVGVDLRPVGLPGHIVVGEGPEPATWFDPFNEGARLGFDDCRQLFARFHPAEAFAPSMLAPIGAEAMAVRSMNNLRAAFTRRGELVRCLPLLELRAAMPSAAVGDRLELAGVLAAVGRHDRAADVFEELIHLDPERAPTYRKQLLRHRAHRN